MKNRSRIVERNVCNPQKSFLKARCTLKQHQINQLCFNFSVHSKIFCQNYEIMIKCLDFLSKFRGKLFFFLPLVYQYVALAVCPALIDYLQEKRTAEMEYLIECQPRPASVGNL